MPVLGLGIATGIIIAYLYVVLLKTFPRPMVYFMIGISLSVIAGLALLGLFTGNTGLFIGMAVTLLIYLLILFCLRKQLNTGIALVSVATNFLSEKASVFITPLVKIVLTFIVGIFYTYSISCMVSIMNNKK